MREALIGIASELRCWVRSSIGRTVQRDLRREQEEQASEGYWQRRERRQRRRLSVVGLRHRFAFLITGERDRFRILRAAAKGILKSGALGAVLIGCVLLVEWSVARSIASWLVPDASNGPPLAAFPRLAVQVLATLLGLYLAAVSIVLGQSYHGVSAAVRDLVFQNRMTMFYLGSIGLSIGMGLALVLIESIGLFTYGYLTIMAYATSILYSGWSVFKLTTYAFGLSNPVVLAHEPLRMLFRAIDRLNSTGLLADEAMRRADARQADRALSILAELIRLTHDRHSIDRDQLADMIEELLHQVQFYSTRKHRLAPTSGWFLPQPTYPKWVEADHRDVSLRLRTSTPLEGRMEPVRDWLEKRSAELSAQAVKACVATNDMDAALRITRAAALTAARLARHYRVEDAVAFYQIIRDHCREIESTNETSQNIASEPPLILTDILVGWREAVAAWPDEISETVARTEWDRRATTAVEIRGPQRVWIAAQQLLQEVHAELDIQGSRTTPDWYLKSALASECILALRELAVQIPDQFDDYARHLDGTRSLPEVRTAIGLQMLQTLAKADVLAETMARSIRELGKLRREEAILDAPELPDLPDHIALSRASILERICEAFGDLQPEESRSQPDYFGHAWFTLVHYTHGAVASGDTELVRRIFAGVFVGTFKLTHHVMATYTAPTYEFTPTHVDSMIDLLELSGLAIVYETLRDDQSAELVRSIWRGWLTDAEAGAARAQFILDTVDYRRSSLMGRGLRRTEWSMRLAKDVVGAGYAQPDAIPFNGKVEWRAPTMIKMLGVHEAMPSVGLDPYVLFAGEVIGPLSGESEERLRARRGLEPYYRKRDLPSGKRRRVRRRDNRSDLDEDDTDE